MRTYPHCLLLSFSIVSACQSTQGQPTLDGAAGGGGSAGHTGTGGGGGATVPDSNARDGAILNDALTMTPLDACRAAVKAQCDRRVACFGSQEQWTADCLRFSNPCPDYYFNEDSDRTVADVFACLDTLANQPCTELYLNLVPPCLSKGKLPSGSACGYSSQCQMGFCMSGPDQCGTCHAHVKLGELCTQYDCELGAFCHPQTKICTSASTIVLADQGQPCSSYGSPLVGCKGNLLCLLGTSSSSDGGSPYTCMPAPGAGQRCGSTDNNIYGICVPGTTCSNDASGTCVPADSCGSAAACDDASYCDPDTLTCRARAAVGQACGDPTIGLPPCLAPAACTAAGNCAVVGAKGDSCDTTHPCADLLSCRGGTCQPIGTCHPDAGI